MEALTVFVVDDEQIVREYYRTLFPWHLAGMRWVGEAAEGQTALEQCRLLRPQLVLIDISMPGMDGLQLLEALQRGLPQTHCVILTSHRDFSYAQTALRLGALDYIVKAVTTPGEMLELLRRVQARIAEHQERAQSGALRQRWLARLLLEGRIDSGATGQASQAAPLSLDSQHIRVLALRQEPGDPATEWGAEADAALPSLALEQALDAAARRLEHAAWTTVGPRSYALIASFAGGAAARSTDATALEACFEQLAAALAPGALLLGGLSELHPSLTTAGQAYREAERALANLFYRDRRSGLEHAPPPWRPLTPETERRLDALIETLPSRDQAAAHTEQTVAAAIGLCRAAAVDPQQTRLLIATLAQQLIGGWRGTVSPWDVALWPTQAAHTPTASALQSWALQTVAGAIMAAGYQHLRPEIQRVLQEIRANLSAPYDLTWAARTAGLHPNYFSTMFRTQTGQTFMDYVSRLRVERAATYLQQGGWNIQQVAEMVGIPNYRTFFNVFRKVMGLSPSEFASQFQRKQQGR